MPKWKCGAIVFIGIDAFFVFALFHDYYEFFIKDCRDAFPFGYCPWGGEAMGWGWRSADVYLSGIASSCSIFLFFIPLALYCFYRQNYKNAFLSAIIPIIIKLITNVVEYILYHYA